MDRSLLGLLFILEFAFLCSSFCVAGVPAEIAEMKAGKTTKAAAHFPKSLPSISIDIAFPKSWVARPVNQDDVLLKYGSPSLDHFVLIRVTPFSAAPELNVPEWTRAMARLEDGSDLGPSLYRDFLHEGAQHLRAKKCMVKSIPSLDIVWDIEEKYNGQGIYLIKRILNIPFDGHFVCIETTVGGLSSPQIRGLARQAFEEADALYDLIFASVSLSSVQTPSPTASPLIKPVNDLLADYSTKEHPKAKGIEMRLGYPKGWKQEEGDRPNVVQKFTNPQGGHMGCLVLVIGNLPDESSDDEIKELFSGEGPSDFLPEGARQISRRHTKIEQLDADIVTFVHRTERAGMTTTLFSQNLVFVINRKIVNIGMSCGEVGGAVNEAELIKRGLQFDPLFKHCINRIVLPSRWGQ